jgi:hypothetical protein
METNIEICGGLVGFGERKLGRLLRLRLVNLSWCSVS